MARNARRPRRRTAPRHWSLGRRFGLAAAFVSIAATAQEPPPSEASYRIGAGDVLDIVVWRNPDLSMAVPVRPDGWITFPLADDVKAAGLTPGALQDEIARLLDPHVASPLVTVVVTTVGSFKVSVLGRVRAAGRFDLSGPASVLDGLALAGG